MFVFRFEEEILTSQRIDDVNDSNSAGTKVVIGSGTFSHVEAQLNNQPPREPVTASATTNSQKPDSVTTKPRLTFSGVESCILLCLHCDLATGAECP